MTLLPYIPDRAKEGYGPSIAAFDTLIDAGASLIITVDCGTLAHAPIAHANARGVPVVVLDHHL
ncbi:MAG: single-stranded-DNA-specific exonuclease RecJ, partial [Azospirillum brasilense]